MLRHCFIGMQVLPLLASIIATPIVCQGLALALRRTGVKGFGLFLAALQEVVKAMVKAIKAGIVAMGRI